MWLGAVLGAFTLLFELSFALAIFFPALAWGYVLTGTAMHTSIFVLQRAPFFQFVALYAVFVEQLRKGVPRRLRPATRPPWTVLYDGACAACIRSMVLVDYADVRRRLAYIDLESEWSAAATRLPALTRTEAMRAMHVVSPDAQVFSGFFAVRALARLLPPLWPLLPLLYLPGTTAVCPRIYAALAWRRARTGCGNGLCVHGTPAASRTDGSPAGPIHAPVHEAEAVPTPAGGTSRAD